MPFDSLVESSKPVLGTVGTIPDVITWPWPRLLKTKYHTFCFTVQASLNLFLSEVTLNSGRFTFIVVADLGPAYLVDQVDIADFGPFYVTTTYGKTTDEVPVSNIKTFIRDLSIPVSFGCMVPFTTPVVGTCCNFRGQFIGGNLQPDSSGIYGELGSAGLVWSGIGSFEFNPVTDPTAGFTQLSFPYSAGRENTIYKLIPHHSGIVLYSDAGKVYVEPKETESGFTYSPSTLRGLGVSSGNHVAGDEFIHGFIDLYGDFWTWELPHVYAKFDAGIMKKLGYRSYIRDLLDSTPSGDHRVIVSFLQKEKRFYISNGNDCLVINEFGACSIFQCVSSIIAGYDGRLYGTFRSTQDTEARFVSDEVDFGTRSLKSIESIVGSIDYAPGSRLQFAVDWRMSDNDAFKRTPWKSTGPRGEAVIKVTASTFRICARITNYIDAAVEYLGLNMKYPDNRFKRGPTMDAGNLVSTRGEV